MPECGALELGCKAQQAANDSVDDLAERAAEFAARCIQEALTWWVHTPTPNPDQPALRAAQTYTWPLVALVLMCSILTAAIRIALTRKGAPAVDVAWGAVQFSVVSTAGLGVLGVATAGADALAGWMLARASQEFVLSMLDAITLKSLGSIGVLLLAMVVAVLGLIQWVLGFLRQAGLIIFAALLPLAAAGSLSQLGKPWLPKLLTTLLALLVWKPAVAFVIILGEALMVAGQGLATVLVGVMILVASLVALPTMMRFFSPLGVSLASGGGGAAGALAGGMMAGRMGGMGGPSGSAGSGAAAPSAAGQQARAISETGPGSGPDPSGAVPSSPSSSTGAGPGSAPDVSPAPAEAADPATGNAAGAAASSASSGTASAAGSAGGGGAAAGGAGPAAPIAAGVIEGGKQIKQGVETAAAEATSESDRPGGAPS